MMIFGVALLTGLTILKSHQLLHPASPLVNIPLIVSLFVNFASDWYGMVGDPGDTDWKMVAIKTMDDAGFDLTTGVANRAEERIAKIREEMDGRDGIAVANESNKVKGKKWRPKEDEEDEVRMWEKWDWDIEVSDNLPLTFSSHNDGRGTVRFWKANASSQRYNSSKSFVEIEPKCLAHSGPARSVRKSRPRSEEHITIS